jgi:hypothetical protein
MDYANKLRLKGFCYPASDLYRQALVRHPNNMAARASLIACLIHLGQYREAESVARIAISYDWQVPTFQALRHTADSALRVGAAPGTVKVTLLSDSVATYMNVGTKP